MRNIIAAALLVAGACFAVPVLAQDSLTATIKSVDEKGTIILSDGSAISYDKGKVEVEGTPEPGAKVSIVFSGDENGYEISKIVVSK